MRILYAALDLFCFVIFFFFIFNDDILSSQYDQLFWKSFIMFSYNDHL